MAIIVNIMMFASPKIVNAEDCSECSSTTWTPLSTTFNYGECNFTIAFDYRVCEEDNYELRIDSIVTNNSECDTTGSLNIYRNSLIYLLSTYYNHFNGQGIDIWDLNKISFIASPCLDKVGGVIKFCSDTLCHKVEYNLTGSQQFTELVGSHTITGNYSIPGPNPCAGITPCGQNVETVYNIPPVNLYQLLNSDPLADENCDEICYWKLEGNSFVDDAYHFLGTTIEQSLRIKTNNIDRMKIFSDGRGHFGNQNNINRILDELTLTDFHFNSSVGVGDPFGGTDYDNGSISLFPKNPGSFYHVDNSNKRGLAFSHGVSPGAHFQYSRTHDEEEASTSNQPPIGSTDIMNLVSWGKKVGIGIIPNNTENYTYNKTGSWNTTTSYGASGPEGMLTVSDTYWHFWGGSDWAVYGGNPVILRLERRDNGYNDGNTNYKLISAGHHSAETFLVRANAKVGINTTNEDALLNIKGLGDDDETFSFIVKNSEDNNLFSIRDDGNVGIGFINKQQKLAVNGKVRIGENEVSDQSAYYDDYMLSVDGIIITEKVVVSTTDWADNVFEPDYKLLKIKELENIIKELGHLPNIPSKNEVLKNGVDLGEMNKILLQKIEELTLYIIEMNKEIEKLKSEKEKENEKN